MRQNTDDFIISNSTSEFSFFNDASNDSCQTHNPASPRLISSINGELNKVSDDTTQQSNELIPSPALVRNPNQAVKLVRNPKQAVKLKTRRPASDDNLAIKHLIRDELQSSGYHNYMNRRPSPIMPAQSRYSDGRAMAMASKQTVNEDMQTQQSRRLSRHHSLSRSRGSSPLLFSQNREFNYYSTHSPVRAKKPRSSSYNQVAFAQSHSLEKIDEADSSASSSSSMKSQLSQLMRSWGITSGRKSSSPSPSSSLSSSGNRVSSLINGADRRISANYAVNYLYNEASPRRSVSDGHGSAISTNLCFNNNESQPELRRSKSLTSRILSKKPWKDIMKCKPASPQKQAAEVAAPARMPVVMPVTPPRRSSASAGSGDEWSTYNNNYYYYSYYGSKSAPTSPANGYAPPGRLSPNAMHYHYHNNKVRSHELRRKTFLPYRQSFLGCLGGGAFASMSGHNPRLAEQAW